jgi:hypothetical protein
MQAENFSSFRCGGLNKTPKAFQSISLVLSLASLQYFNGNLQEPGQGFIRKKERLLRCVPQSFCPGFLFSVSPALKVFNINGILRGAI